MFTSHNSTKYSCHIVIDHYVHSNNEEARGFYHNVISRMNEDYAKFVDPSVYGSTQDFRFVGNQKFKSGRVKKFQSKWKFRGTEIQYKFPTEFGDLEIICNSSKIQPNSRIYSNEFTLLEELHILKSSLVSWSEDCKVLPYYTYDKKPIDKSTKNSITYAVLQNVETPEFSYVNVELTRELIIKAFYKTKLYMKEKYRITKFPFIIGKIKDISIDLTRKSHSYCPICERIHENIAAYLLITGNRQKILYMCYNDSSIPKLKITIGYLNEIDNIIKDVLESSSSTHTLVPAHVPVISHIIKTKHEITTDIDEIKSLNNMIDRQTNDAKISNKLHNSIYDKQNNNIKKQELLLSNSSITKPSFIFDIEKMTENKKMINHHSDVVEMMKIFMNK